MVFRSLRAKFGVTEDDIVVSFSTEYLSMKYVTTTFYVNKEYFHIILNE